jgi:hypothetical protein
LVQPLCVELLPGHRAGLDLLEGCPDVVDEDPPVRDLPGTLHERRLALRHQGPLFVHDLLRVGSGEFLELSPFRVREPMGEPEDLGKRVGLGLHRNACTPELLPHGDDHERKQHGVDDTQDGVDEAGHVVVPLAYF